MSLRGMIALASRSDQKPIGRWHALSPVCHHYGPAENTDPFQCAILGVRVAADRFCKAVTKDVGPSSRPVARRGSQPRGISRHASITLFRTSAASPRIVVRRRRSLRRRQLPSSAEGFRGLGDPFGTFSRLLDTQALRSPNAMSIPIQKLRGN